MMDFARKVEGAKKSNGSKMRATSDNVPLFVNPGVGSGRRAQQKLSRSGCHSIPSIFVLYPSTMSNGSGLEPRLSGGIAFKTDEVFADHFFNSKPDLFKTVIKFDWSSSASCSVSAPTQISFSYVWCVNAARTEANSSQSSCPRLILTRAVRETAPN